MSNHENATGAPDLDALIAEKGAAEVEKKRLTEEITALNNRLINPETKQEEKGVLKVKINELKNQNRLLKQKIAGIGWI